ncbi:hypothetical protein QTJ16_005930 [Diplocarpon rosae]|uniref:Uncharacterized protein n=1 Tax=Diplocarpon rosae TaxID=946125 RepID=A0AAD9WAY6_9HELO|nr:hypothetical protein QTJ16_005930 [Diplocarpon rosae]PBP21817.1 hypothetical protein BUE80_DR007372 [Diplocarpon rosae]
MASVIRASTPPPSSSIRTPDTPRYGYDDDYQPYAPRKSTRVKQRPRDVATPPPRQSSKKTSATYLSSSPSSPQTARKKRAPPNNASERQVSGTLTNDTTVSAASSLGFATPSTSRKSTQPPSAIFNNGMLPTPVKTPVDRPKHLALATTSVARNLFPVRSSSVEEAMPTPKRRGCRNNTGFTIGDSEDSQIAIFTDSQDRIPEIDESSENPFYGAPNMTITGPGRSKRRKITVPGEGEISIEDLEKRTDGAVYVFRGKRMFRKFKEEYECDVESQSDESDLEQLSDGDQTLTTNLHRPLTRSSLVPRLLFPQSEQELAKDIKSHSTEDEEADTDIEEAAGGVSTPSAQVTEYAITPKAPRFGPTTPPTTTRTTRTKKFESDDKSITNSSMLHSFGTASGRASPSGGFEDLKRPPPKARGKKRRGEILDRGRGCDKRTRGHTVTQSA